MNRRPKQPVETVRAWAPLDVARPGAGRGGALHLPVVRAPDGAGRWDGGVQRQRQDQLRDGLEQQLRPAPGRAHRLAGRRPRRRLGARGRGVRRRPAVAGEDGSPDPSWRASGPDGRRRRRVRQHHAGRRFHQRRCALPHLSRDVRPGPWLRRCGVRCAARPAPARVGRVDARRRAPGHGRRLDLDPAVPGHPIDARLGAAPERGEGKERCPGRVAVPRQPPGVRAPGALGRAGPLRAHAAASSDGRPPPRRGC